MKIRNGFVSNSSSSSFIVIDTKNKFNHVGIKKLKCYDSNSNKLIVDSRLGEIEFGWGPANIYGWGSLLIFTFLQIQYSYRNDKLSNNNWLEMLEKVIKETLNIDGIIWNIGIDWNDATDDGYIDHASNATEDKNIGMFKSEEILKAFIFGKNSYIHLDNDNY